MQKLQIIKRPTLTKGQKDLYSLICAKLERDEMILFDEAKEIWLSKSCREVRNGVPHWYDIWGKKNEKEEWEGCYKPMAEWMITQRVLFWLVSNIGSLVLKGYLKIIPMIEIKKLDK